jgi:hypothetical protein
MPISSATNPVVSEITVGGALISTGTAAPTFSAAKGSLFVRTDTGASTTATRLYINSTGATAWVAITTAS